MARLSFGGTIFLGVGNKLLVRKGFELYSKKILSHTPVEEAFYCGKR